MNLLPVCLMVCWSTRSANKSKPCLTRNTEFNLIYLKWLHHRKETLGITRLSKSTKFTMCMRNNLNKLWTVRYNNGEARNNVGMSGKFGCGCSTQTLNLQNIPWSKKLHFSLSLKFLRTVWWLVTRPLSEEQCVSSSSSKASQVVPQGSVLG